MTPLEGVTYAISQLMKKTLRDDDYEEAQQALEVLFGLQARVQCWDEV